MVMVGHDERLARNFRKRSTQLYRVMNPSRSIESSTHNLSINLVYN